MRRLLNGLLTAGFGLVVFSAPLSASDRVPLSIRIVVQEGETVPGVLESLSTFSQPMINENGDVAFVGRAGGTAGVWKEQNQSLTLVAASGTPAPESGGHDFGGFEDLILNDAGQTAWVAGLTSAPFRQESGIWAEGTGGIRKVVQRSDIAPLTGEPAPRYFEQPFAQDVALIFPFALNNEGDVAFFSVLRLADLTTAGEGVFKEVDEVLVLEGVTRFPGQTQGISNLTDSNTYNDNGAVGVVKEDQEGPHLDGGPASGDLAPDTGGAEFASFGRPDINAEGEMVFYATLRSTPSAIVSSVDNTAIYSTAGGTHLVARENAPAPGTTATFQDMTSHPVINRRGEVAFENSLRNTPNGQNWGIWTTAGQTGLRKVIQAGDPAPDLPPGVSFRFSSALPAAKNLILNGRGNLVFVAQIEGPGIDGSNNLGIFADIQGELFLVLRIGEDIELAPGDIRRIGSIGGFSESSTFDYGIAGGTGNADGRHSAFNDKDQLTCGLFFADGSSGVFVIDDLEVALARRITQTTLSLDPDGHPTINYTALPGLTYSITRRPELSDPDNSTLLLPDTGYTLRARYTFPDPSITIRPGTPAVPRFAFYFLRYSKMP